MYEGPSGEPFILEDRTGSLTSTTFTDIYDKLTVTFSESLVRPNRTVTMVRITSSSSGVVEDQLIPQAVVDWGMGTVMFPPKPNMPLETYMRRMPGPISG